MNLPKEKEIIKTPVETVTGWLLIFVSFLVMSFGFNNGEINIVFWVGVGLIPIGIVLVVTGKQRQRASKESSMR
jgi:uncharacterized protein YqgC (DUF456 family)